MPLLKKKREEFANAPGTLYLLVSFLCTCVFAAACTVLMLELFVTIPLIVQIITGNTRFFAFARNFSAIALALVWIALFIFLWNRLERAASYKKMLVRTAVWTGAAAAAYAVSIAAHTLIARSLIG